MKRILTAVLLVSACSASTTTRLPRQMMHLTSNKPAATQHNGKWYMAANGHAVYCYGPVMMVDDGSDGIKRMATFCRGGAPMVALHD
jgi:hypothetical protein